MFTYASWHRLGMRSIRNTVGIWGNSCEGWSHEGSVTMFACFGQFCCTDYSWCEYGTVLTDSPNPRVCRHVNESKQCISHLTKMSTFILCLVFEIIFHWSAILIVQEQHDTVALTPHILLCCTKLAAACQMSICCSGISKYGSSVWYLMPWSLKHALWGKASFLTKLGEGIACIYIMCIYTYIYGLYTYIKYIYMACLHIHICTSHIYIWCICTSYISTSHIYTLYMINLIILWLWIYVKYNLILQDFLSRPTELESRLHIIRHVDTYWRRILESTLHGRHLLLLS